MAAAVALATMLTSCSGSSDTDTGAEDAKGGDSTSSAPVAEPGEFDSLPEPCGLPARRTLRSLLPTDGSPETPAEADKVYRGRADVTFDTDRRVGCHWKRETSEGTRHLNIDLQRVVSYDGSVSDDAKAQELYAKRELAAHIPSGTPSAPTPSASKGSGASGDKGEQSEKSGGTSGRGAGSDADSRTGAGSGTRPSGGKGPVADSSADPAGSAQRDGSETAGDTTGDTAGSTAGNTPGDAQDTGSGKGSGSGTRPSDTHTAEGDSPSSSGASGSPDPSGSSGSGSPDDAASLAPRPLADVGDAAFLDDALVTADSGLHRDVTVVFRSSNVIVTIEYDQWSTDKSVLPDRRELQEKARALAAELAAHWTE
ncbi:hypothetical protein [Streptomyces purpurogeneiscleroticus]|uniref:hypothetical protein n=1 Tax=Streptomyces purpurogeneiscleroticus TaxID=68259 RepID=UPI001CBABC31|nr:hypothetical protein [Streptomyces purpurogeneiscleroticus]